MTPDDLLAVGRAIGFGLLVLAAALVGVAGLFALVAYYLEPTPEQEVGPMPARPKLRVLDGGSPGRSR